MSGATRSRSATDPITDPISGSGHAGRLQHLKNTRRARKVGGAWAQASSCTALWDVQELRRKRTRQENSIYQQVEERDKAQEGGQEEDQEQQHGTPVLEEACVAAVTADPRCWGCRRCLCLYGDASPCP
ncbi:uncharacterized [Tachysurus ichikawai]